MQRVRVLLAAAAFGTLMSLPQPSTAGPLATGLESGDAVETRAGSSSVETIHYKKYKKKHYKHYRRYPRYHFYPRYSYYYDDCYWDPYYCYPSYSYYRPYRRYHYPYLYSPGPFIGFSFGF